MTTFDFSQKPYFDDLDETKQFHRIMFHPSVAVQARELNQLQSLQHLQMQRLAKHIFEEGAMVVPGGVSFDLDYQFVKCVSNSNLDQSAYRDANFLNKILVGANGAKGLVVNHTGPDGNGDVTFYVRYTKSATSGVVQTFVADELLTIEGTGTTATVAPSLRTPIGAGCAAFIDRGVYHVRGMFMLVEKQTLIMDAYTNTPSYRVGLKLVETIVTPDDDPSLNSNAQGSYNYGAPGADRYKATLVLTKLPLDAVGTTTSENFYELLKFDDGELQKIVQITDYSELEKTFARRTFDESGDYTVRPFFLRPIAHPSDNTKIRIEIDPGKAYVRGYEIQKVGKSYVDIDRSQDYARVDNASIPTPIGSYVLVSKVDGDAPDLLNMSTVDLQSKIDSTTGSDVIGTARVRTIVYDSGTLGTAAIYRLYLFDIKITDATKTFSDVAKISNATFSAVPERQYTFVTGQTITNSGTAVTGNGGTKWQNDPNALQQVKVGDYIYIGGAIGALRRVTAVASNTGLTVDSTYTDGTYNFAYTYVELYDPSTTPALFPLPHSFIRKVKTTDDTTSDVSYTVKRVFSGTVASNAITINTGNTDEEFLPKSLDNFTVIQTSGSTGVKDHMAYTFGSLPASSLSISGMSLADGTTVKVIATIRKKSGSPISPKLKSLTTGAVLTTASGAQNLDVVSLGKADVYRVTAIYMKVNDFSTAPTGAGDGQNITSWYEVDTGQRDTHYDLGRILKRPGTPPITGRIRIEFDYFTHSGAASYFSADSYNGVVAYEAIPSYSSRDTGYTYQLRDCLDFRPRINDAGTAFDNTTGHLTELPTNEFVSADYSYYLNRIDKLYLNYRGEFKVIKGVAGLIPQAPASPTDDGMVTHILNVQAYTVGPQSVFVDYQDNKRYTMRDIGKLEKRVENLEYYTSLTLLEKETQALEIKDSVTGIDRFKSGFIVDPFKGHGIGDVQNPDYRCSIDMQNHELRPMFIERVCPLTLNVGLSTDYQKTGDLITLPYTHQVLVDQPLASNAMNVNPFNVMSFLGLMDLVPPQDEWKDTETAPDLIINQDGDFDSIKAMADGMGTIWDEWRQVGTGVPVASNEETLLTIKEVSTKPMLHLRSSGAVDKKAVETNRISRPGQDTWPWRENQIVRTTTTIETNEQRTGTKINVTPKTILENIGEHVVNVAYVPFIRSREVTFTGKGLKPNTRVYPFFDGSPVSSVTRPSGGTNGDALITDVSGNISGVFTIPAATFRTGARVFRLTSSSTNDPETWTTQSSAVYRAQGLLETKQATILSTRTAEVAWEQVTDDRIVRNDQIDINTVNGKWRDPLAQTILITKPGGCFLSKIQLFFRSKDPSIPVQVEIRDVVNGYPGSNVLPFSQVMLQPSSVHTNDIVNSQLVIDGGTPLPAFDSSDFVATEFVFPSPVYCKEGFEYAIVVLSNSNNYETWVATFGNNPNTQSAYTLVGTSRPVENQPYAGSLFKSQNSSTWTAAQESDLMFKLFCAKFDTTKQPDLYLNNSALPAKALGTNPVQTAVNSKKIRVNHPWHGLAVGSKVTLAGLTNINGLPAGRLNATQTVDSCDLQSYVIDLPSVTLTSASTSGTTLTGTGFNTKLVAGSVVYHAGTTTYRTVASVTNDTTAVLSSAFSPDLSNQTLEVFAGTAGIGGGSSATATENYQMDVLHPIIGRMEMPQTSATFYVKATSGKSPDGSQTPYVLDSTYSPIVVNTNVTFSSPKLIASGVNETNLMSGNKSMIVRAVLASSNENISPVIDTSRLSVLAIANLIDNGTQSTRNVDPLDTRTLQTATNIAFAAGANGTDGKITSSNATTSGLLAQATAGKYVIVSGASNGGNNGTFLVKSVVLSGSNVTITVDSLMVTESAAATVTVKLLDKFVGENAQGSSAAAKYVCRRMFLSEVANSLRISFALNKPAEADVEVWYRISRVDDQTPFDELPYRKATPDAALKTNTDYTEFVDTVYNVNLPAEDFNGVSLKIVMKSTSTAQIPRGKDLRVIALATSE